MSIDYDWPEIRAAKALGITYGKYVAMTYNPDEPPKPRQQKINRNRKRRFTDEAAFILWQQGKTDAEVAAAFNVSRTIIQRWRDVLELPSTTKEKVDTKKYRLEQIQDGQFVAICEN